MKNSEIAKIAGLSNATIFKILYLKDQSKYKFRQETIDKVIWLKNFDSNIERMFREKTFIMLCDVILDKTKKRDSKKYEQIIELANSCKWFGSKKNYGIVRVTHYKAFDVFTDSDFSDMCRLAIRKSNNGKVREMALELESLSRTFRNKLKLN